MVFAERCRGYAGRRVTAYGLLPALVLALALPAARACSDTDCACIRQLNGPGLTFDGKTIDASLQDPGWSGSFDTIRTGGGRYVGTDENLVTSTYFWQKASLSMVNGMKLSMPVSLTYCPLNTTRVANAQLTASIVGTRYDIWWVISNTQSGLLAPVQCMSVARMPDTSGKNLMTWQTQASTCPGVTWPLAADVTAATYTGYSSASAAGRATPLAAAAAAVAIAGVALGAAGF